MTTYVRHYPKVFDAFNAMDRDGGAVTPLSDATPIPSDYVDFFIEAELGLATLKEEDFLTVCCGEDTATRKILARFPDETADAIEKILDDYFEGILFSKEYR